MKLAKEEIGVNNTLITSMRRKVEMFEPILQLRADGQNLRNCLTDYIINEWKVKLSDTYMERK